MGQHTQIDKAHFNGKHYTTKNKPRYHKGKSNAFYGAKKDVKKENGFKKRVNGGKELVHNSLQCNSYS